MRAARLHAARDVRIEELPVPEPGPGEVLVRVRAVSVCPSDWRLYDSGDAGGAPLQAPIVQGHEFSGDIVATGEGVTDPPVGSRVAVEPTWHCGHCDVCRRGRHNICRNVRFPSFPPVDGALAEYAVCPAHATQVIPPTLSYTAGALVEPLGVAIHALRLARVSPDESVVILGAGMIGLCTLQVLRSSGVAEVGVVEPVAGRRELAGRCGADSVNAAVEELLARQVEADLVFECTGAPGAAAQALQLAAPGGKVIVVGIPHPETVCFEAHLPRRKELTIVFSRRSRDTLGEALELAATGKVDLLSLPVRRFTLAQTAAALDATAACPDDMLRAIVEP